MPKITFIEFSGVQHELVAEVGQSVMQSALSHSVPGIIGDCGGNCACATCHVYIAEPWAGRFPAVAAAEREMIDCALHVRESSRLGCQLMVTAELDGLVVGLPESQT